MGLREQLNENPRVVTGLTVAIIVVVLAMLLWPRANGGGSIGSGKQAKLFFTTDDGETYFPDDAANVPPFQKGGREAVRAVVMQCGNGKPFVNHLTRFTPQGKRAMEEAQKKGGRAPNDPTLFEMMEVKAPKTRDWVKINDPKAEAILSVKCPGGGNAADSHEVAP